MEIYEPLDKSLQYVGSFMNAAEAHGLLCGLLCAPQFFADEIWFKHILGQSAAEDGLASECQRQLLLVKHYTLNQLNSPDCEFMLLLPFDDISLSDRIQALGGWCEGFSFGLGFASIQTQHLSHDAREFIQDVILVSRIAPVEQDTENAENNYMQLVEYVRIGVLTLYEELMVIAGQHG